MDFLPVFLNLKGKMCLVVGGGEVAVRKAALLLQAGAVLRIVAPQLDDTFKLPPGSAHLAERFQSTHLLGMTLAIAATDDALVNEQVSLAANTASGILSIFNMVRAASAPALALRSLMISRSLSIAIL